MEHVKELEIRSSHLEFPPASFPSLADGVPAIDEPEPDKEVCASHVVCVGEGEGWQRSHPPETRWCFVRGLGSRKEKESRTL